MTDKKINKSKLKGVLKLEDLDKNIKNSISRYITKDYIYEKENIIITDNGNKLIFLHKTSDGKLKGIRTIQKDGKVLNTEYKSDCLNTLYNADGVDGDNLIVTIGEFDALFLLSQGIENVVAIAKKDNLDFIREHYDFLQSKNKIKFIVSNKKIDDKTYIEKYGNELINRLGKDKVSLLEYEKDDLVEEYNNLNLELIEGISSLKKNVKVKNLITFDSIKSEKVQLTSWGDPSFSGLLGGKRSNEITVLLGGTGTGKTSVVNNLVCSLADNNESIIVLSGEASEGETKDQLLNYFAGKENLKSIENPFSKNRRILEIKNDEIKNKIVDWIDDKIRIFKYDVIAKTDEVLKTIEEGYKKLGITTIFLDNLMTLSYSKSGKFENTNADEIDFMLKLGALVRALPIHVVLVAHPKKTLNPEDLGALDIRGVSEISNLASNIVILRRLKEEEQEEFLLKNDREASLELKLAKDRRYGMINAKTLMNYNHKTGRLHSAYKSDEYKFKWQIEYEKKKKIIN